MLEQTSVTDQDEANYHEFVNANLPRNFVAHFAHGMLGMTGFRIIHAPTFLPAYIHLLTGSPFLVGLSQAMLQAGSIVSPIIGAAQIEHRHKILPMAVRIGSLMRVQILGLAMVGWLLSGLPLLLGTLLFLLLLGFFTGAQRVVFQALMAKVIPLRVRGRLQAWRNFAGGVIAAALSYWAGIYLIERNMLGNGYATTFMLSFLLTSLGLAILYLLLREPPAPTVRERISLRQRIRESPQLLRDANYRYFVFAQLLASIGRMALPFCIIYAGQTMAIDGAALGKLTLTFLAAETLANLLWGNLGDRLGFRVIFLAAVLCWLAALVLILTAHSEWQFLLGFCGLGAALSGYMMSTTTMVLEFGSRQDIPMRLALSSTAESSMAVLGPLLGGLIATRFGMTPVFLAAIASLALAALVIVFLLREPRNQPQELPALR